MDLKERILFDCGSTKKVFRFFGQDFPTVVSCHLRWQAPAGVKVSFSICHVSVHFHFGSSVEPQSVRLFRGVCRKKEKNWNRLAVLGAARLRRGWTLVYIYFAEV